MKYFSANQRNCVKELMLLQLLVEYKLVNLYLTFCNQWPASKNNSSNAFRNCFWHTSLLYPTYWLCKLHFKTIANFSL